LIFLVITTLLALAEHNAVKSDDAVIVLTSAGYLTGAADVCKVAPSESNQLSSGMALAISNGGYGDPAAAHVLFNTARQKGIEAAIAKTVDCDKVRDSLVRYVRALRKPQ
jgi:hypothetical protein